jgi:hypothetical protein
MRPVIRMAAAYPGASPGPGRVEFPRSARVKTGDCSLQVEGMHPHTVRPDIWLPICEWQKSSLLTASQTPIPECRQRPTTGPPPPRRFQWPLSGRDRHLNVSNPLPAEGRLLAGDCLMRTAWTARISQGPDRRHATLHSRSLTLLPNGRIWGLMCLRRPTVGPIVLSLADEHRKNSR